MKKTWMRLLTTMLATVLLLSVGAAAWAEEPVTFDSENLT